MTPSSGERNIATFDAGTVEPGHVERRVVRASGFVPVEAKMHPPLLRDDLVIRSDLLSRMNGAAPSTVMLVGAPPGYGKTSVIRQWVDADPRPFAWLTLDASDNDAATLVTYLMLVLQRIEPVDLDVLAPLTGGDAAISAVVLPRLGRMLRRRSQPFVLVLDEADVITSPDALGTLSVIIDNLPKGSQLVVIARAAPDLPWHRLRAERRVTDVSVDDLRLTVDESRELVETAGRDASSSDLVALVERTEGWATGLYLALLSTSSQQPVSHDAVPVAGDNALVAAYLRDELLARLPADQQSFLLRASVLDRMSGPLCDAALDTTGSGSMLRRLGDANLFVVPLDGRDRWYRLHQLFADMLQAELQRVDSGIVPQLHSRASRWFEQAGDVDQAIRHARLSGDLIRAADLVWNQVPACLVSGRRATLQRWLDAFTKEQVLSHTKLALTVAWGDFGRRHSVQHWLAAAERGRYDRDRPGEAESVLAATALVRATLAQQGVKRMGSDARLAAQLVGPGDPWAGLAFFLEGAALHLTGARAAAREQLTKAERAAFADDIHTVRAVALAELALIAIEAGDWSGATDIIDDALAVVERNGLEHVREMAPVYCASALGLARRGLASEARLHARRGTQLLAAVTGPAPWFAVQARIVLARTHLLLDDPAAALILLAETRPYASTVADATVLNEQLDDLRKQVKLSGGSLSTASSLTTAELRVLQYLPSHLSFEQISERLFVSRNTVKTQAIAVYRKLAVSSRAEAVDRAHALGLLQE